MVGIDENAQVGIELATSTLRLTGRAIIAIMDLFLDSDKDNRKQYYQELDNKQGKQKLKDLFTKHDNTSVESLGENLSKDEQTFISKELKAMGVDFSVRKIGKDDYSLFFAGKDSEAIEKGMKNAIEKFAKRQQRIDTLKEKVKGKEKVPDKNIDSINKKSVANEKNINDTKQKSKESPKFSINGLQEKYNKNKRLQREEKVKVRNKVPKRSL